MNQFNTFSISVSANTNISNHGRIKIRHHKLEHFKLSFNAQRLRLTGETIKPHGKSIVR